MEWDEERDGKFRLQMPNLSTGEGRTLEARGEDTVTMTPKNRGVR